MTHALHTGPIRGTVTLADGTVVDVTDPVIYLESQERAGEVAHFIGLRHEREGHPSHTRPGADDHDPIRDAFHHVCSARHCGPHARTLDEHHAAFDEHLERHGAAHLIGSEAHAERRAQLADAHEHVNADHGQESQ